MLKDILVYDVLNAKNGMGISVHFKVLRTPFVVIPIFGIVRIIKAFFQ